MTGNNSTDRTERPDEHELIQGTTGPAEEHMETVKPESAKPVAMLESEETGLVDFIEFVISK